MVVNNGAPPGLQGQLAVVTGASCGLGRELALALAREGCDLLICARRPQRLDVVEKEVLDLGVDCLNWEGDLTVDIGAFMRVVGSKPVHILINNAGYAPALKPMEDLQGKDLRHVLELNLLVPFHVMRAVVPNMKEQGSGTVVNICSLAGRRAIRNASIYSASKFALRGMTEAVAQELEGTGIRVFSASPGGMQTQMRQKLFGDADQQQDPAAVAQIIVDAIAGRIPVGQGEDLVVRGGSFTTVPREQWVGVRMERWPDHRAALSDLTPV